MLAVILPLFILIIPTFAAPMNTLTVCPLGCDYAAIQPAIDAAAPGDTILIAEGTYTGQLILKSDLTLLAQSGPTQTIISASTSPIVSGSHLSSVTLDGLGITGSDPVTDVIGIDLLNSSMLLSNTIISELHGANGTPVYTDGLNAIGLRLSETFNVTVSNSIFENITGGDAELDSMGRGGDGIGLAATGDGQLMIISSTVRNLAGGAAGMSTDWIGCYMCCNGAGGRSLGIDKAGPSNLRIERTHIADLIGGQPCRGSYSPNCRWNAGQVIGIRAGSGTLDLNNSAIVGLHGRTSYTNAPNVAVSTSHSSEVHIADNEIADLTAFETSTSAQQPAAPYCAPPPSSAIGIASNGDSNVQITRNNLHDIIGINENGYSKGISVLSSQVITMTGNRLIQLRGGSRAEWWPPYRTSKPLALRLVQLRPRWSRITA
jgi:hypothetical protein